MQVLAPAYHGDITGFYAYAGGQAGTRPAVVLVHEWWGLNDYIKGEAQRLAAEGFAVLAVDLYGGQVAEKGDQETAMALMTGVVAEEALANMRAAVAWLRGRPEVAGGRVAAMGWCFGGAQALKLALAQPDLAGVVIYYGVQLETDPAKLAGMPPVLGLFGAEDTSPPPERVRAFQAALAEARVPAQVLLYDGAGHAFANATRDDRYRPEQAQAAWRETVEFLSELGEVRR